MVQGFLVDLELRLAHDPLLNQLAWSIYLELDFGDPQSRL